MSNFYITGISGSGKTAVAAELNRRGIHAMDIDTVKDLCFWRNKKTLMQDNYFNGIGADWIQDHEWVFNEKRLMEILSGYNNVALTGVTANQNDYLQFFKKIFVLSCDPKTIIERLGGRTGEGEFGKDDAERKLVLKQKTEFEEDLVKKGAIKVSTDQPLSATVDEIANEMKKWL